MPSKLEPDMSRVTPPSGVTQQGHLPRHNRGGAPRKFKRGIAETFLRRVASGKRYTVVCKDPTMPSAMTVRGWLLGQAIDPEDREWFVVAFNEARRLGADHLFDEIIDIADDVDESPAAIAKARLRAESRKYTVERLAPDRYAPTQYIGHGQDPNAAPVQQPTLDVAKLSDEQQQQALELAQSLLQQGAIDVTPDTNQDNTEE